jgi:hypothetical protein
MMAALVLFRDMVIAAILGWVGVSYQPAPQPARQDKGTCPAAEAGATLTSGQCTSRIKAFDSDLCER